MHLRLHVPGVRDNASCRLKWRSCGHTIVVALLHWSYSDADLIIVDVCKLAKTRRRWCNARGEDDSIYPALATM